MLIVTMPLSGITTGTQTILGYNFGARRPDRIVKAEKNIFFMCLVFTTVMFIIAHTIPEYFVRIFTKDETYVKVTVDAIKVYTLGVIPLAAQYTIVDGFTGMGLSLAAMSLSTFRKTIFFLCVFCIPPLFGVEYVFYTEPVSDIVGAIGSVIVFALCFKRLIGLK